MNLEIKEILQYLSNRKDYVIWAGFAQHAHLGLKCSPDIDIFTDSLETAKQISSDFQQKGWEIAPKPFEIPGYWDKLKNKETTFDIVCSQTATELFFKDKVEIEVESYNLNFISKEVLFLTKLGQYRTKVRTDEKRKRDLEVINRLSGAIDVDKVKELALKLPESYWRTGLV